MIEHPILYTFRRCPYAIRARMGLAYAGLNIEHREVVLKDKPEEMLKLSPKATVPLLLLENGEVIDESLDILNWAVAQNDADQWKGYSPNELSLMADLIEENDFSFKKHLDHYKYADRYPDHSEEVYRSRCEAFLRKLEEKLSASTYLFGKDISYADVAIMSFIRQFSKVDEAWFAASPYPFVRHWLAGFLNSELFLSVMKKHSPWKSNQQEPSTISLSHHS